MRGKEVRALGETLEKGITPAYAGKSLVAAKPAFPDQDHPRLCGEKLATFAHSSKVTGSPPPMRGKVTMTQKLELARRITPAYAGKSF